MLIQMRLKEELKKKKYIIRYIQEQKEQERKKLLNITTLFLIRKHLRISNSINKKKSFVLNFLNQILHKPLEMIFQEVIDWVQWDRSQRVDWEDKVQKDPELLEIKKLKRRKVEESLQLDLDLYHLNQDIEFKHAIILL